MNGFEKRASRIKDKISKATLELLRETEPKRIRIADVAAKAGVSQVTIYNYYGSKEVLFTEVFKSYFEKAVDDFESHMNEGHSLKEKIEYIILLEKASYKEFPPGVIKEFIFQDEGLKRYIEGQYQERAIPLMVRMIEEGQESGEISADASIETILAFIQLFMNEYENLLEMAQKSGDIEKFLESMVNLFFYGICGKPSKDEE